MDRVDRPPPATIDPYVVVATSDGGHAAAEAEGTLGASKRIPSNHSLRQGRKLCQQMRRFLLWLRLMSVWLIEYCRCIWCTRQTLPRRRGWECCCEFVRDGLVVAHQKGDELTPFELQHLSTQWRRLPYQYNSSLIPLQLPPQQIVLHSASLIHCSTMCPDVTIRFLQGRLLNLLKVFKASSDPFNNI